MAGTKGKHHQPKGYSRKNLHSSIESRIWEEVGRLADTFHHTRAWVISTILADYLRIDLDPEYYKHRDEPVKQRKRSKQRRGK